MPTVWMRDHPRRRGRFHRTPDCRQLRKPPALGEHYDLLELELSEIGVRPCQTCYPDAPRVKMLKRYCPACASVYPCEHNGGVQIVRSHGERYWVWPDTNQMPLFRSKF